MSCWDVQLHKDRWMNSGCDTERDETVVCWTQKSQLDCDA